MGTLLLARLTSESPESQRQTSMMEKKLLLCVVLVAALCVYTQASPLREELELKLLSRLLETGQEAKQEVVQKREQKSEAPLLETLIAKLLNKRLCLPGSPDYRTCSG